MSKPIIRPATINDTQTILNFINDLAIYEKAQHEVLTTEQHIHSTLFCKDPKAFALISLIDGKAVGFAVYFFSYSTWLGKYGIYLEDLYVAKDERGKGAGKSLLKELAKIAISKECGILEWSVLDWNEPSIKFYEAMRAKPKDGWIVYRLEGSELTNFANS